MILTANNSKMTDTLDTIFILASDALDTIALSLQNFFHTSVEVASKGYDVAHTFVWGLMVMLWNTLESFAQFLGASVNFVASNLVILVLLLVGMFVYRSRSPRASRHPTPKKKQA